MVIPADFVSITGYNFRRKHEVVWMYQGLFKYLPSIGKRQRQQFFSVFVKDIKDKKLKRYCLGGFRNPVFPFSRNCFLKRNEFIMLFVVSDSLTVHNQFA